jgi:hypothetical protein
MHSALARVTRINLLESEYLLVLLAAELQWIRRVMKQLAGKKLTWDFDQVIREIWASRK